VSKQSVLTRCNQARYKAHRAAEQSLMTNIGVDFRISDFSRSTDRLWREQWQPVNIRQPPNGGWDWVASRELHRNDPSVFGAAILIGERLCGLALATVSNAAVRVNLLEGDPRPDCMLKGHVLRIILEASACYAQLLGRDELHVLDPVEGLIATYTDDVFKFTLVTPRKGAPYLRRRV
jgi:hypothetical protein